MKKGTLKFIKYAFFGVFFMIIFVLWLNLYIQQSTKEYIFENTKDISIDTQTVMILWARVYKNWDLSDIMRDRTDTVISIFTNNRSDTILISADNSRTNYDEVRPTRDYLIEHWISSGKIFLDFAGFDTYDSMYRAKNIFGIKTMVISSQRFYLPRAVWIARTMWIDAYWIVADKRRYLYRKHYAVREIFANVKAFGEVVLWIDSYFTGKIIYITWESNAFWYD